MRFIVSAGLLAIGMAIPIVLPFLYLNLSEAFNKIAKGPEVYLLFLTGAGALFGLKHHRDREREFKELEMRRDIYRDAMDAIANGATFLARAGHTNITHEEWTKIVADNAARFNRVDLVASQPTVDAFYAFQREFSRAEIYMFDKRMIIMHLKENLDRFEKFRGEILAEMQRVMLIKDPADRQKENDRLGKLSRQVASDIKCISTELRQNQLNTMQAALDMLKNLGNVQAKCMLLARHEMGFQIDSDEYAKRCVTFNRDIHTAGTEMLKGYQEQLEKEKKANIDMLQRQK
jgi:hypothetical protein